MSSFKTGGKVGYLEQASAVILMVKNPINITASMVPYQLPRSLLNGRLILIIIPVLTKIK